MTRIRVIKIYSQKDDVVMDGYSMIGGSKEDSYRAIIKEHGIRNFGKFICVDYMDDSVCVTLYNMGIHEGKGEVMLLKKETLKEIIDGFKEVRME